MSIHNSKCYMVFLHPSQTLPPTNINNKTNTSKPQGFLYFYLLTFLHYFSSKPSSTFQTSYSKTQSTWIAYQKHQNQYANAKSSKREKICHLGFVVKDLVFSMHENLSLSFFDDDEITEIRRHCSFSFIQKQVLGLFPFAALFLFLLALGWDCKSRRLSPSIQSFGLRVCESSIKPRKILYVELSVIFKTLSFSLLRISF